jgi:aryl-alcohol dehydrogenase-like predicted oxidoreductase
MFISPRVTVGTMNFGARTPAAEARRIVDFAFERGATMFDTANVYGDGESERIVGAALEGRRDRATIATKVGLRRTGGGAVEGLAPARITAAVAESLARLKTDWVDLLYLHAPDPATPISQTLDALQSLLERGTVKAWGVSNYASWQILEINALCDARGLARPAVSQVLYNLLVRQLDVEYFAFTKAHPLHTTVYNPLAAGLLARAAPATGGARLAQNPLYRRRYGSEVMLEAAKDYAGLAAEHGLDGATLAYAWLACCPGVDSILAGPATVDHLRVALEAAHVSLPNEVRAQIDALAVRLAGTDVRYAR